MLNTREIVDEIDVILHHTGPALAPEKRLTYRQIREHLIALRNSVEAARVGHDLPTFGEVHPVDLLMSGVHITCPPGHRIVVECPKE